MLATTNRHTRSRSAASFEIAPSSLTDSMLATTNPHTRTIWMDGARWLDGHPHGARRFHAPARRDHELSYASTDSSLQHSRVATSLQRSCTAGQRHGPRLRLREPRRAQSASSSALSDRIRPSPRSATPSATPSPRSATPAPRSPPPHAGTPRSEIEWAASSPRTPNAQPLPATSSARHARRMQLRGNIDPSHWFWGSSALHVGEVRARPDDAVQKGAGRRDQPRNEARTWPTARAPRDTVCACTPPGLEWVSAPPVRRGLPWGGYDA